MGWPRHKKDGQQALELLAKFGRGCLKGGAAITGICAGEYAKDFHASLPILRNVVATVGYISHITEQSTAA